MENGYWQPRIGDPTLMGWVTVIAYLVTAFLCANRSLKTQRDRWFWMTLSAILLLLGINKQLDLQSWLTLIGKQMAIEQGWYRERRQFQFDFILGLIAVSFAGLMFLIQGMGKSWKRFMLALLGLIFLLSFIVIRATSFHHVDVLLGREFSGFRLNWLFELGGISCIAIAAIKN
ncbi:isopropylmalate isomerase [Aphanothece sacrum FPU3]|nr:isopropylmalate isomerase [Aphanothece sacrum FPU3]